MDLIRTTFSLRWKILSWFFVNLLILGVALFLFLRVQLRIGIDSLVAGPTSDRLEAIAQPLAAQLREQPHTRWAALVERLARDWRSRGVSVALFRDDGAYVAGDVRALPSEVQDRIKNYEFRHHGLAPWLAGKEGGPDHHPPSPPDFSRGPPRADDSNPFEHRFHDGPRRMEPPDGFGPPMDLEAPVSGDDAPTAATAGPFDKFLLAAGSPQRYWAGVHLGEMEHPNSALGKSPSATLVFASDSLRGGGLFFDYYPWLTFAVGAVIVSTLIWVPFVRGVTNSLGRMMHTAEEVAQGRFRAPHVSKRRDELGRLSRALGHMAARLEESATGQKRFLGDTAHELLSPLARMEVALSILEQKADPDGDRRHIVRALGEVRHTSALVHDLLAFTKAGMRRRAAELEPVPLAEAARRAVAREAAEGKVSVEISEDLRACADPDLLTRALVNTIRNAVRYAGEAGPIRIIAAPGGGNDGGDGEEGGAGSIELHIVDQGPGVPPEALPRLFDPFYRPETARTRESGGTGLGLAIVKSCIEACGGQVSVRNLAPNGLQLTFRLQRAE